MTVQLVSGLGINPQFAATDKVLGRSTAGAGAGEEIACTAAGRNIIAGTVPFMGKNKLINGNQQVWQRGTTFVPTTAGMYCSDRFLITPAGASLTEAGQEATAALVPPNLLSLYSLRLRGNASVTTVDIAQRIEAKNAAPLRQNCTFSFWLYSSGQAAAFKPKVLINTANVADVFTAVTNKLSQDQDDNTVGAWKKYTVTFDATAYANAEKGIEVVIRIPDGNLHDTDHYVYLSQLQLEAGAAATEFENKLYGETLRDCEFYCYKLGGRNAVELIGVGKTYSTTEAQLYAAIPQMRSQPVATFVGAAAGLSANNATNTYYAATSAGAAAYGPNGFVVYFTYATGAIFTAGHATQMYFNAATTYILLEAEL